MTLNDGLRRVIYISTSSFDLTRHVIVTIFLLALGQGDFVCGWLREGAQDDATLDHQIDGGAAIAQDGNGRPVIDVLQRNAVDAHDPVVDPESQKKEKKKKGNLLLIQLHRRHHFVVFFSHYQTAPHRIDLRALKD